MAQETSELWKTLWRAKNTRKEYGFDINDIWYGPEAEVSHSVDSGLYESFGIGNATTAQLSISLFADDIPRGVTIKRYIRLKNGDQVSEWLPKGVFFASRRAEDDGRWSLEAYDAMRKAETVWEPDQALEFPMTMPDAVAEFARIMGVEIDPRTSLNPAYTIDYPASDTTIRNELCWIAAAHGGNFIFTDAGKLLLIPLLSIPPETSYLVDENGDAITFGDTRILIGDSGASAQSASESEKFFVGLDVTGGENNGRRNPISRITLWPDDNNCLTAGDDTGMELEADCPHATQDMVDNILAQVKGYQYQAYSAEAANIDPAAELGDGVNVNGVYFVVARIADDGSGYPSLSAPGEEELEDEYPVVGPMTLEFSRQIAETRSRITKTAEEIRLEVYNEIDGLSASLDIQLDSITADIEGLDGRTASLEMGLDGISAQVTDNTNAIAAIDLYVDSLTLSVSNGSTSSTISLKAGSTTIASQSISFSGMVTFSDLSTAGGTTINGSNITTGTLYADYIKLYGDLAVYTTKTGSAVGGYVGYTSSLLDGGTGIHMMNSYGTGEVRVTNSGVAMEAPGGGKVVCTGNCNITGTYIYFYAGSGSFEMGSTYFAPQTSGSLYCGLSGQRWSTVYCTAVNESSDRALKDNISYSIDKYDAFFDRLKPCSHTFIADANKITHTRLVADDVDKALADSGLSRNDFAGLCMSDVEGESGIVYSEFISILIDQVQKLKGRVAVLEGRL